LTAPVPRQSRCHEVDARILIAQRTFAIEKPKRVRG
jgi:hypothetical protein